MVSSIESIPLSIFHKHGLAVSVCSFLILGRVGTLELQLEPVGDEGDEFGICRLALGVGYGVAEEALEGVQIFIALLVGLMPYDLLGYGYSTIESTKTQLFCICVILYIQRVTRLRIYIY